MADIKIHIFHTSEVCVAPELPFGGEHCSTIKASGVFAKRSERLWLPVSATGFEKAAEMKNSHMFTMFKPASAKAVAEAGYKAARRGKTLRYYGLPANAVNIAVRILPRSVCRKFMKKVNG